VPRELLFALIGGIASAILSIGWFGPVPILAVGLHLGSALASIAAAVGALSILIAFNGLNSLVYIAGTAMPAMIIVRQALISQPSSSPGKLTWYPPGLILGLLVAWGLIVLAAVALYFAIATDGLQAASHNVLRELFAQIIQQSGTGTGTGASEAQLAKISDALAARLAPVLPGMLVAGSLLILIPNAAITQGLLARTGHALRPTPAYAALELPLWLAGALAVALVVAFLPGALGGYGRNAALLLSTPFLLLGLTVIHTLSRRAPKPGSVLGAFYVGLVFAGLVLGLAVPLLALITLLGIVEQFFSLRQRFAAPGANQEDE
jgi:hypothetical protein